jgi:Ca2+/Na+ antiporter
VIRSVVVFVVVLVLLLIAIGSFGAVGPWELLLALVVALVVAFAVYSRRRRAAV